MKDFIPFALPEIDIEEIDAVVQVMKKGWISTGPKVMEFEKKFADYVDSKHAIAVNSATAGMHLALDAIGLTRGDKVIVPTYTFTATAEVVRYFDADPIFCDSNPDDFNICVDELEKLIVKTVDQFGEKLKAIIPVHIAGKPADLKRIGELAKKYKLRIIEDAAHALPSRYNGKPIGSISDLTVFSFYATKTITTAEGGMITTNSDEFRNRINIMRLHGFNRSAWDRYTNDKPSWFYEVVAPGYKYNMTDISAAIGIEQLNKLSTFTEKRNCIALRYSNELSGVSGIKLPSQVSDGLVHSHHLYMIRVPKKDRNLFIETMAERGVGCSVHFIPLHLQPYWRDKYSLKEEEFSVAQSLFEEEVSLPIYTRMSDSQQDHIINTIKKISEELNW